MIEGVPSMIFVEASYSIETVEAERISVDQIARILPGAGGSAHASQRASPVPRRRTPQPSLARNRLTVVLPTQALPSGGWRTLSDAALLVPKSTLRGTPQGASLGRPPNDLTAALLYVYRVSAFSATLNPPPKKWFGRSSGGSLRSVLEEPPTCPAHNTPAQSRLLPGKQNGYPPSQGN